MVGCIKAIMFGRCHYCHIILQVMNKQTVRTFEYRCRAVWAAVPLRIHITTVISSMWQAKSTIRMHSTLKQRVSMQWWLMYCLLSSLLHLHSFLHSPRHSYLEDYAVKLPESILWLPSNSNSPAMDHTAGSWAWITSHWRGPFHTRMELQRISLSV